MYTKRGGSSAAITFGINLHTRILQYMNGTLGHNQQEAQQWAPFKDVDDYTLAKLDKGSYISNAQWKKKYFQSSESMYYTEPTLIKQAGVVLHVICCNCLLNRCYLSTQQRYSEQLSKGVEN